MTPESCPKCQKSFQGEPIPEDVRERLGYTSTHYSNLLCGITQGRDRVTHYQCPFCGLVWPREGANPDPLPA